MDEVHATMSRIQSAAAARILGVSQRSVQALACRGELPGAARIGGSWTFDRAKLSAFIDQRERDAERPAIPARALKQARLPTQARTNAAYARLMSERFERSASSGVKCAR